MTPQNLLDQFEIRSLISRYNILGDRAQIAEMIKIFAPDARLRAVRKTAIGHDEIARLLSATPMSSRHTVTRHHLGTQVIDVEGDAASARTYFMVYTNIGPDHHGIYVDRLARLGGQWVIVDRDVRLDWQAPNSVYEPMPVHERG